MNEDQLLAKYGVNANEHPSATPSGQEYRATKKERCPYCGMVTVSREWRVDDDEDPNAGYWILVCSNKECPQPERIPLPFMQ